MGDAEGDITHPLEDDMPAIKYRVTLTDEEIEMLEALLSKGKSAARKQTRARILLKAAAGIKDAAIMEALAVSATMIYTPKHGSWLNIAEIELAVLS